MDERSTLATALSNRYEIDREIGRGGMATVYLARDVRHDRRVAVKVLHPDLAAALGAERFLAEIKTTANLQHPHILPLHDSGEADGLLYYVMPFVEGETLRDRLTREKMLPIEDSVRIITETLGALDYAHRHGVIHRDVKPENILLHDGSALVADFGIALAVTAAAGPRMTQTGLSLGTPQYMSPEQAMGERTIDGRADVYACGAILYEMLTGDPPFTGSTMQAIVAKVITEKPSPPSTVRTTVSARVEAAILTALAKSPADRFSTAAKFAEALDRATSDPDVATAAGSERTAVGRGHSGVVAAMLVAGIVIGALLTAAIVRRTGSGSTPNTNVARAQIVFAPNQGIIPPEQGPSFTMSRDGSLMVYVGPSAASGSQLWLRHMDQLTARPITGTESGILPAISPDNRELAFETMSSRTMRIISIEGGAPRDVASQVRRGGLTWGADNMLYYRQLDASIMRVSPAGGDAERVSKGIGVAAATGAGHLWPDPLPGGKAVIVTDRAAGAENSASRIAVVDIGSNTVTDLTTGVYARYVPGGYMVWAMADGSVYGATLDTKTFALGKPRLLIDHVRIEGSLGSADFAFSDDGRLVYQLGDVSEDNLVWMNRKGVTQPIDITGFHPNLGGTIALSPDGRRLAASRGSGTGVDIWVKDLPVGALTRLTTEGEPNTSPSWTADGRRIAFSSSRGANSAAGLYIRRADGTGSDSLVIRLSKHGIGQSVWSPDGNWLVFADGGQLYVKHVGADTVVTPLTGSTQFLERDPSFSPDSRFIAYTSTESGRQEIYVRPFPNVTAGKWTVSVAGGRIPRWSHSGREIFYRGAQSLLSATVTTVPTFAVLRQDTVITNSGLAQGSPFFEAAPDGNRFVMVRPRRGAEGLVLVENWFNEVRSAPPQR